jgi:hypothetical protein
MRSKKGSRRIVVDGVEYRWRAKGDHPSIMIGIWPANGIGPYISGNFRYHETWIPSGEGQARSAGDQIVITSRIIKRVIEYARTTQGYDPHTPGKELLLRRLDGLIQWEDAVRGSGGSRG